ncbi:hypothetical protein K438DRAFT_1865056 [Mycena galopus ATCC 62051]|nr:hypothetical protein K438DRAFT_1865056 [Mycena galopus ATCC 62051]
MANLYKKLCDKLCTSRTTPNISHDSTLSESRSTSKNEPRSLPSTPDCSSEPPQTGSKSPASSLTLENLSESSEFSSSPLLSVSVTELGDFEPVCGGSEELSGIDGSEHGSFVDVDLDSNSVESWDYVRDALDTAMHEQAAAVIMDEVKKDSQCSELYDSGTTCHITPFRVPLALQKNLVLCCTLRKWDTHLSSRTIVMQR